MAKTKAKIDWDAELFDKHGKPKRALKPETWFAYMVKKAGGIPSLATQLGVSRQAIYGGPKQPAWTKIPDRFVPIASKLYGIPREQLAPHLYE
jgi:hypothetical protein